MIAARVGHLGLIGVGLSLAAVATDVTGPGRLRVLDRRFVVRGQGTPEERSLVVRVEPAAAEIADRRDSVIRSGHVTPPFGVEPP